MSVCLFILGMCTFLWYRITGVQLRRNSRLFIPPKARKPEYYDLKDFFFFFLDGKLTSLLTVAT